MNGLGTAIKECIIDNHMEDVKIKAYAYPDEFIRHGSVDELEKIYYLDEEYIVEDIQRFMGLRTNGENQMTTETDKQENKQEEESLMV